MAAAISDLRDWGSTPEGRKAIRYTLVSVVSTVVSQITLVILFGLFDFTARSANVWACIVGGVPSYWLNRKWAWGKSGRSHLWKEVVPFWTLAFLGLVASTWAADFAESWGRSNFDSHLIRTFVVVAGSLGAFGVLWILKFLVFNKFLFVEHGARD